MRSTLVVTILSLVIPAKNHAFQVSNNGAVTGYTTNVMPTKMQDHFQLGSLSVPSIGIGTIAWSSTDPFRLENPQVEELVQEAVARDAAFFDTAERYGSHWKTAFGMGYGETERLTAALLQKATTTTTSSSTTTTPPAVVATKFTPTPWRTTVDAVVQACQESCRNLGVPSLDLYQIHMPDIVHPGHALLGLDRQPKDDLYWRGLIECYERGLVRNVGVCNYGPSLTLACQERLARAGVPLVSNQIAYSLVGRSPQAERTVQVCQDSGIQVMAAFPLAMGLLTGKYSTAGSSSNNNNNPKQSPSSSAIATALSQNSKTALEQGDLQQFAAEQMGPLSTVLDQLAAKYDRTPAQISLNYLLCRQIMPIPGARNRAQLLDNVQARDFVLSDDDVAWLEDATIGRQTFQGAGFKRTGEKFVGYGVEKWSLD